MAQVLDTTKYTQPGVYVQKLYQPKLSADSSFTRIPCYVGAGPQSLLYEDQPVVRGYISDEPLAFTTVAPYRAMTKFINDGVEDSARLIDAEGEEVDNRVWEFVQDENGRYIGIEISTASYDPTKTYLLSYQSVDPTALDDTLIDDLESIVEMGLQPSGNDFSASDYELETTIGNFAIGSDLYAPDQEQNTGTGDLPQVTSSSKYVGPTRKYHLAIDAVQNVQLPQVLSVLPGSGNTGTGLLTLLVDGWANSIDTVYSFKVAAISTDGNSVTFDWTRDNPSASGQITIRRGFETNVAFVDGLRLNSNDLTLYRVNDTYAYNIGLRQSPQLLVSWAADDIGGGTGDLIVTPLNRAAVKWTAGMELIFGSNLSNYKAGDVFSAQMTSTGRIKWKYDLAGSQNVSINDVSFDQTGAITGTRRAYYLTLNESRVQKVTGVTLVDELGNETDLVPTTDYRHVVGTSYVVFTQKPAGSYARVTYEYTNAPSYGQTYYVDAYAMKPMEQYDKVLYLNSDNYRKMVGYPDQSNHLGIMAEIAFEAGAQQIAIIQVRDSDRDGNYSVADFRRAIVSGRDDKNFSDLIVLSKNDAIGETVAELEIRNDPFRSSETLGWFGYPVNTDVGSAQKLPGTLTYYGGKVLQVPASSNSHGCHISVANTWAKRTITGRSGRQTQLTLDGSFIAGTLAAITATFAQPWNTLLRHVVGAFDEVENFGANDISVLGPYGFAILEQIEDVVRVLDIVTHDNSAPDYRQVNAMTQKQWISHTVRERMDQAVIAIVPASQEDGEVLVASALLDILSDMVTRGFIGKYQNEDGTSRPIDRDKDIAVDRSSSDPTKYFMRWQCFLRYHIARVNGLYSVDTTVLFS